MERVLRPLLLVLALLRGPVLFAAQSEPPETPVRLVVDTLYGTPVPDSYRWLEDSDSEEVQAWFRAQGAYSRNILDWLPGHAALLERIRAIGEAAPLDISLPREAGGRWFYTIRRAGEPVARGYVRDAWTGEERLLVDPAAVGGGGEAGANTLATFLPSPDGQLILYGVSSGGSENVVLRVRDVATGRDVEGPFERNTFDFCVWNPDGRTFFYHQLRDLPADTPPAERYRGIQILQHHMGDDTASDVSVLSAEALDLDDRFFPFIIVDARSGLAFGILTPGTQHGAWFVASIEGLSTGNPRWQPLFALADSVESVIPHGTDLYALTRKGTSRIVRTALHAPNLATAENVMVEGEQRIQGMSGALDGLYVSLFAEGINRITRIPWRGGPVPIDLPPGTSVAESPDIQADPLRAGLLLTLTSWTMVPRPYRYNPSTDTLEELSFRSLGPYDLFEGYAVETIYAPSHDDVRVPLTVVRPEPFARDGSLPVVLIGYGAYGETDAPRYIAERVPWYESGGALAVCHVRGGGYYGQAWHLAGQKATKPNTWLDFIACAEHLIREDYTRPERLAALGASAGGITVGRAITERPDLFAGAVIQNGMLDAVRFETTSAGPPNVHEFGSIATEDGFRALHAMSPLHHVRPGTAYPAVLLATSLNDARVAPWQSGKMAGALQAATTSGRPVLLRVEETAGHMPLEQSAELQQQLLADFFGFFMTQTGMPPYRPPEKTR